MSCLHDPGNAIAPGPVVPAAERGRLMGRVLEFIHAFKGRRVLADLGRLDQRMLRDLGLMRSDLVEAATLPISRDPTLVLLERAAERRAARYAGKSVQSDLYF